MSPTSPATNFSGIDQPHPRFARMYPRCAARADARGAAAHRRRLVSGLSGRVIEVGAGHGANFAHYPAGVSEVVAVEPEPTLRALAEAAARAAPVPVSVVPGTAEALPGEGFDAAVTSLVLCSVPDQAVALSEIRRVLRPGGELRFYEHVVPERGPRRLLLLAADRSGLWPKLAAGCHPARDTAAAIAAAGLEISECERIEFRAAPIEPAIPHILGTAVLPA